MSEEQDSIFFFNYTVVIGILAVMVILFIVLARVFGDNEDSYMKIRAESTAENTAPIGKISIAGRKEPTVAVAEPAPIEGSQEAVDIGKQVYTGLCFSCHSTGLPGIPQVGDAAAWTERAANGNALLYERAITGFTGASGIMMPPKGGNPALSDDEVRAAVDYMLVNSQ